jgi:hypothetical protein
MITRLRPARCANLKYLQLGKIFSGRPEIFQRGAVNLRKQSCAYRARRQTRKKMEENMEQSAGQAGRIVMIHYRRHALRVAIGVEIRFVTEDIVRIAGIRGSPGDCDGALSRAGAGPLGLPETLGWSQALNLLDWGDLSSRELQGFGEWMLAGAIEQLCGDEALTGTEMIDTSTVHHSSFFRKALLAADPSRCQGGLLLQ